ncbi:MAG: AMP-binding protein [bacterium]
MKNIVELITSLSSYPDQGITAYRSDKKITLSYPEFSEQILKLAAGLQKYGLNEGDRVAIIGKNSIDWLVVCLGAIAAGVTVVPLNQDLNEEELSTVLEDSTPALIFTDGEYAGGLRSLEVELPEIYFLSSEKNKEKNWREILADQPLTSAQLSAVDPAVIFYTSGTTGRPKGVPLTHQNLIFSIRSVKNAGIVNSKDRVLLPLPLYHVYPFVVGTLTPLALGLSVVFPASFTGPDIVQALTDSAITVIIGVPRLYRALVEGIEERIEKSKWPVQRLLRGLLLLSGFLRRKFNISLGKILLTPLHRRIAPRLRMLASGGAALDEELAWKLEALGWEVNTGYGLTETSPLLSLNLSHYNNFGSAGKPLPGVEIKIDSDPVPESAAEEGWGEVLARGGNVFSGYRNLPEETESSFTGEGWFRTGDMGKRGVDNFLYLQGRVSTMIVTESGKNIQPAHLEDIYGESEVIEEIGVLADERKLAALVVPDLEQLQHRGESDVRAGIEAQLKKIGRELPEYQRLSDFEISYDEIPRTRLGKIRRHLLEKMYIEAKENTSGVSTGSPCPVEQMEEEDRKILEDEAARKVWDWLADKYSNQQLTPATDFQLELGVDSLQWVDFTLRIEELVDVQLTEEQVGEIQIVRDLLREVAKKQTAGRGGNQKEVNPLEKPEGFLNDEQKKWLQSRNLFHRLLNGGFYWLNRVLMKIVFRIQVSGGNNIPNDQNFVLAPNHVSYFDPFFLGAALEYDTMYRTHWAAWRQAAFSNPLFRLGCRMAGVVPVDPLNNPASSLAYGEAILRKGWNLAWFPEGRRSPDGQLQDFQPGLGILLKNRQTSVIPTYIEGAEKVLPPGRKIPKFHRVKITFGEPVSPEILAEEGEGELREKRIISALRSRVLGLARD